MTQVTALSVVRTFDRYEEKNQFGAIRMSCLVAGKYYHGHQFYDLTEIMTPYQACEKAAEKLLEAIVA